MPFRIAIGTCSCQPPYADKIQAAVCSAVAALLQDWRVRFPADLGEFPAEWTENRDVEGYRVTFRTEKRALPSGQTLAVFQALVHTWSRPTFLSTAAVGRLYAEGLLVSEDGTVLRAPDEVMWEFR
jgi:hypothetical protein